MKTTIKISHNIYESIASGDKHMIKVARSQEPYAGLVRLEEYGSQNHIDIFVTKKRKIANKVNVYFNLIAIYGVG